MRIGIEIGWGNRTGGARTVARQLVRSMAELRPGWRFIVLSNTKQAGLDRPNVEQHILPVPCECLYNIYNHVVFPHMQVPGFFAGKGVDVVHYTNSIISFRRPFRTVLSLHDISPFRAPSSWSFLLRMYMKFHLKALAPMADAIITSSRSSEADIRQVLGVPASRIRVIPHAVGEEFGVIREGRRLEDVRKRLRLPGRFILFVGTIQPRKNLERLMEAYSILNGREAGGRGLVIVGRKGWGQVDVVRLARKMKIENRVVYIENARQSDMPCIYNMAELFVYPALYEGFGLPPLEAMACGVPVVASKSSSIPEVVGDAAVLIDPENVDDITGAISVVLRNEELRQRLVRKGYERVKIYSWKRSAAETIEVYEELGS